MEAFQRIRCTEIEFLPLAQGCRKPPFYSLRRRVPRLTSRISALSGARCFSTPRVDPSTQRNEGSRDPSTSRKPKGEKASQRKVDLQSLGDLFREQGESVDFRSLGSPGGRFSQEARGSRSLRKEVPSKEEVRPKGGRQHLFLDPPADLKQDLQSARTAGLQSSGVDRKFFSVSDADERSKLEPARRRSNRSSRRNFDVLDDIMASKGQRSKALIENIQAEAASESDEILKVMRNSAEDHVTVSSMGPKVSTSDHIKSKDHGKSSEKYVLSETVDDRKIVDDDDIATVSRSNIFAKSIEKVLAPSGTFKPSDATPNSMGGTNIQQKESSQLMSSESEMGDAQPGLKGHDVLWALQKAALEKAKRKQKSSKMNPRNMKAKQSLPLNDVDDWKNAKPISLRPEWALQMDDLEKRIEQLKCQTSLL